MTIVHDGLAIFRFGAGKPLLFMPYPHAVNVAGDATPSALVDGVVDLGRQVITFDPPGAGRSTRPMRLTMQEMLDYSGQLGEIGVPTLVLAGRHDPQMPVACAEELASGITNAHLDIFEQSGHYPFIEEAEAFWEAVRRFLEVAGESLSDTAADGVEIGGKIASHWKG